MPRFVILEHDHPQVHWDLMLETGDVLRTWRLADAPFTTAEPILATTIGDHRRSYLDYEGPVSGNRGYVVRWDGGTYEALALSDSDVHIRLQGARLCGTAHLTRTCGDDWRWRFLEGDGAAQ